MACVEGHGPFSMMVAELGVILAISTVMLWPARARLRAVIRALPRRYAVACLTSLGLLLVGQASPRNQDTYPLVAWDMYTANEPGDPRFVEYIGRLASGREDRLLLGRLFPAGGRHLRARIDSVALAVARESLASGREQAIGHLDSLLAAVGSAWDAQHPTDSVRAIRVQLGTVPARTYTGPGSITRRVVHEYRIP